VQFKLNSCLRGADGWAKNQLGERRLGELFLGDRHTLWATTVISEKDVSPKDGWATKA